MTASAAATQRIEHCEVVVVGAGPAGSAAAATLAREGVQVTVIDRARFPRDKLCGGLLTRRAAKMYARAFNRPWHPVIEAQSRGMHLHDGSHAALSRLNGVQDSHLLEFTCRARFDHFLLEQALDAGAQAVLGQGVSEVDTLNGLITLTDGRRWQAQVVIGADGVNSRVAHALHGRGLDPRHTALALEVEVPRDWGGSVQDPEIYFGVVHWGYAWVFPKQETLTVGLGGLQSANAGLKNSLRDFLCLRFPSHPIESLRVRGHHLPYGRFERRPGGARTLLCGDAAGLVEPITGEGIAFALQSGHAAACAARRSVREGGSALHHYLPEYRGVTADLRWANRLRHLVFAPRLEGLFLRTLPSMQSAPTRMMELMADELSYPAWSRLVGRSIWRRLRRAAVDRLSLSSH